MAWRVARMEWTLWRRDGRTAALGGVVALLLVAALAGGLASAVEGARVKAELTALDRDLFHGLTGTNPHGAAHVGRYQYTSLSPLAFVDRGLADGFGQYMRAEPHSQPGYESAPGRNRTTFARLGSLSAGRVLQQLVPLLFVLLLAGAIAAERENGLLRQMAAAGVSPRTVLLGKAVAAGGVVAGIVATLGVAGLVAIALTSDAHWRNDLVRLGGLAGLYAMYYAWWIGLILAISSRVRRASVALAIAGAIWVATAALLPRITADIATARQPLPEWQEFSRALFRDSPRGGRDGGMKMLRERLKDELFARYGVSRLQDLPVYFEGMVLERVEEQDTEAIRRHWARAWDRYDDQEWSSIVLGLAAPTLSMKPLSAALTGTDLWHFRHFFDAAERHRFAFVQALNRDLTVNARITGELYSDRVPGGASTGDEWHNYDSGRALYAGLPEFVYQRPSVAAALMARLPAMLALLLWVVGTWSVTWWSVRRFEGT
jgi:ABC-2 type transport system permease protein